MGLAEEIIKVVVCKNSELKSAFLKIEENCATSKFRDCEPHLVQESISSSEENTLKIQDVEERQDNSSKNVGLGKIESEEIVVCKRCGHKSAFIEAEEISSKNKFGNCEPHFVQKQGESISSSEISSKNVECGKTESAEESQEVVICKNSEFKSISSTEGEENSSKHKFDDCQPDRVQEHVGSTSSTEENNSQNEDVTKCESTDQVTVTVKNNEPTPASSGQSEETKENQTDENEPEKSELNNLLTKEALGDELAVHWTGTSHKPYALIPVAEDTTEFKQVVRIFAPTCRTLKITKLERIENPYLLALYLNKKEKMRQENSFVDERNLFHGTSTRCVDSICTNNFDWRRCGTSTGHKFGRGVSFTPEVSYAFHYGHSRLMILTKVLVSKSTVGDGDTVVPPEPYDTTTNLPDTVIVKYEDDDFLPQYVIHYEITNGSLHYLFI